MAIELPKPPAPWALWFDPAGRAIRPLPRAAVADLAGAGPLDDALSYWLRRLDIQAQPWMVRRWLKASGGWTAGELTDHRRNLARLRWCWAWEARELKDPGHLLDLRER
jgi:hypothetical protein